MQAVGERWLKEHPEASQRLLDVLTTVVIDYMSAQVSAGADLLQVCCCRAVTALSRLCHGCFGSVTALSRLCHGCFGSVMDRMWRGW